MEFRGGSGVESRVETGSLCLLSHWRVEIRIAARTIVWIKDALAITLGSLDKKPIAGIKANNSQENI